MEIRRDKINEAVEEVCRIFDDLGLSYEEREIVHRSGWKTAAEYQLDEEIRKEFEEMLRKPTLEERVMKVLPPVIASAAIIISLIAILF